MIAPAFLRTGASMHLTMLRSASGAVAVSWILWLVGPLTEGISDGWMVDHWYPAATAVMFVLADLALFVAVAVNRVEVYLVVLRATGLTMVVALVLLAFHPYTGQNNLVDGLWWTGFSALPAVAFALSVPPRVAVPFFLAVSGGAAVANAVIAGYTGPLLFTANVGFALVNGFLFVWLSAATLGLGRIVDNTEDRIRQNLVRAARLRARTEEMGRFTALVHDNVLANLAAIGQGVRPDGLLEVRLASTFEGSPEVAPDQLIDAAVRAVQDAGPDCGLDIVVREDAQPVPTVVASPMVLALAEVARNSAKHAPGAHRWCRLRIAGDRIGFRFADDGPGFDMADLRPTAAGVRISVLGRMDAVEGGEAHVRSAPGEGTEVRLLWEGRDAWAPERRIGTDVGEEALAPAPLMHFTGMDVVFSRGYAVAISAVFYVMMAADSSPADPAGLLTWGILSTALALMVGVQCRDLPRWRIVVVGAAICAAVLVGLWQGTGGAETWLRQWHASAAVLVGALLTVRGYPRTALTAVGSTAVLLWILHTTGVSPDGYTTPGRYLTSAILVIAAVLVYVGMFSFIRRVPAAQEQLRASAAEAAVAQVSAQSRAENLRMLESAVGPVFTAAAEMGQITGPLAQRAKLTELRLRDMIRSPLLDVPALRAAVRDARAHGVTVLLLDDRSRSGGDGPAQDGVDAVAAVDRLLGEFLQIIDTAQDAAAGTAGTGDPVDGGTGDDGAERRVTVRLLPPGRSAFATVTDGTGVVRFAASGERL